MKNLLLLFTALFTFNLAFAGESKLSEIDGPDQIQCCDHSNFEIDVKNVNPNFAIEGIYGVWVIRRNGIILYEENQTPPFNELFPGELITFHFEVPMEFTNFDAELQITFEFHSDFDLNPDPTESTSTQIVGCGITRDEAIDIFEADLQGVLNDPFAYMFVYGHLLKPGTVIHGSGSDHYEMILDEFAWLSIIYNPLLGFEQPVTIAIMNSNTEEINIIDAFWPPVINDVKYIPEIDHQDMVTGDPIGTIDPPVPFDFVHEASVAKDSVCAILVSGIDKRYFFQSAFDNDVDYMKDYLTHHPNGPHLDESNVLIRKSKFGYNRDSLLMDIMKLKDKYSKVYFYYSGHGSQDGSMCLGDDESKWMDYETFVRELFNSGAKNYCLMVDACFSGKIIDYVCSDPHLPDIDVDVIAACVGTQPSFVQPYSVNNVVTWFGDMTAHFLFTANDPATDSNGDGVHEFHEILEKVVKDNYHEINDFQSPTGKYMPNLTTSILGAMIWHNAQDAYGPVADKATIHVFPLYFPDGTLIRSFDEQVQFIMPFPGYLGWVDWNPNALFGHSVTYALIDYDLNSGQVIFRDGSEYWPVIPDFPAYNAFAPNDEYRNGTDYLTGAPNVPIFQDASGPGTFTDFDIAIIIKGLTANPAQQTAINEAANQFALNLQNEAFGEHFHPDNVKIFSGIDVTTLDSYLESLNGYKKVFFYYAGNITSGGLINLGNEPVQWTSFDHLYNKLLSLGAVDYNLFFEGSHSGKALFSLPGYSFKDKTVNLFTSSNGDSPSFVNFYIDAQMNMTGADLAWTNSILVPYGNPVVDKDGVSGTSFKEAYNYLFLNNPPLLNSTLFDLSSPGNISTQPYDSPGDVTDEHVFTGIDLGLEIDQRSSAIDLVASQEVNIHPQTFFPGVIYGISPVRVWKMEGTLDPDPSLKADVVFYYNPLMDTISTSNGILGLVSRISSDQEWEPYYPATYDEVTGTITAEDVTDMREWAIARVSTPDGTHDPITAIKEVCAYPDPVNDVLSVSVSLDHVQPLSFTIIDLCGNVLENIISKEYQPGLQTVQFDVSHFISGMYLVEIVDRNKVMTKGFVKM